MRSTVRKLTSPAVTPARHPGAGAEELPFLSLSKQQPAKLPESSPEAREDQPLLQAHTRPRTVGTIQLAIWVFLCANGGAYGAEEIVASTSPVILIVAILLVPWVWCLPVALVTAELSTAFSNSSGGMIEWAGKAFGLRFSIVSSLFYWASNTTDNSMYSILIPQYLGHLFDHELPFWLKVVFGLCIIAIVVAINASGLEFSGGAAIVLSCLTLTPIFLLVLFSLPKVDPNVWISTEVKSGHTDWSVVFALVLWLFSGFDDVGSMADAIKKPQRTYPRAMILAIIVIIVSMELTVLTTLCVDQRWHKWDEGYFAEIARQVGGQALRLTLGFGAVFGLFSNLLAQLLATAQAIHYMALQGWLPRFLTAQREHDGTQWAAIVFAGVITSCFQLVNFKILAEVHTVFYSIVVVIEMASFLALRVRFATMPRPYTAVSPVFWKAVLLTLGPVVIVAANVYSASRYTKKVVAGFALFTMLVAAAHWLWEQATGQHGDAADAGSVGASAQKQAAPAAAGAASIEAKADSRIESDDYAPIGGGSGSGSSGGRSIMGGPQLTATTSSVFGSRVQIVDAGSGGSGSGFLHGSINGGSGGAGSGDSDVAVDVGIAPRRSSAAAGSAPKPAAPMPQRNGSAQSAAAGSYGATGSAAGSLPKDKQQAQVRAQPAAAAAPHKTAAKSSFRPDRFHAAREDRIDGAGGGNDESGSEVE